jgi:hypothetical protein
MKERRLTDRDRERSVVEREGNGKRAGLRIENSSDADQPSRRDAVRVSRDLDLRGDDATCPRRLGFWNLSHHVDLRGVDDPE